MCVPTGPSNFLLRQRWGKGPQRQLAELVGIRVWLLGWDIAQISSDYLACREP